MSPRFAGRVARLYHRNTYFQNFSLPHTLISSLSLLLILTLSLMLSTLPVKHNQSLLRPAGMTPPFHSHCHPHRSESLDAQMLSFYPLSISPSPNRPDLRDCSLISYTISSFQMFSIQKISPRFYLNSQGTYLFDLCVFMKTTCDLKSIENEERFQGHAQRTQFRMFAHCIHNAHAPDAAE